MTTPLPPSFDAILAEHRALHDANPDAYVREHPRPVIWDGVPVSTLQGIAVRLEQETARLRELLCLALWLWQEERWLTLRLHAPLSLDLLDESLHAVEPVDGEQ